MKRFCVLLTTVILLGTFALSVALMVKSKEPASQEPVSSLSEDTRVKTPVTSDLSNALETERHITYIYGNEDHIYPDSPITRGETADIIYSLLRNPPKTDMSYFTDVSGNSRYADSVNALAELGVIDAESDKFRPSRNITRGEFLDILTRFYSREEGEMRFTDVPDTYEYYDAVMTAVAKGWLSWYTEEAFLPDENITLAQAVTVLNRALGREADRSRINKDGKILQFLDLSYSHWAYYDIMEASVPHSYNTHSDEEIWSEYDILPSQRLPGYHSIDGELYYVQTDGTFAKNISVGYLKFNGSGKYTTGIAELDSRLTDIVVAQTAEGDARWTNLKRLYDHVCDDYSYLAGDFIEVGTDTGWEAKRALDMLETGKDNCYGYAALFTMLARKMGYQATGVSGAAFNNTYWNWIDHGWTQIELNGELYVCDTELEGVYAVNNGLDWDLFMRPYSAAELPIYMVYDEILGE